MFPAGDNSLTINKNATPQVLANGGNLTYTITISNTSDFDAFVDSISDVLPPGMSYVALGAGDVTTANSNSVPSGGATGTLEWVAQPTDNYAVPANSSIELVYTATVQSVSGMYTNSATLNSGLASSGPASEDIFVGEVADLSVTMTDSSDPVAAGGQFSYQLTVSNAGPDAASGVVLTDTLPNGVSFVSATPGSPTCIESSGTVSCNLGTVSSGGSSMVTILVSADSPGLWTNQATVTGNESDPNPNNNTASEQTTITGVSDLVLTLTDSADPVAVGSSFNYQLTVSNVGTQSANGVTLTDTLPAGVTYVSATPSQGSCSESMGTVSCSLGAISALGDAMVSVTVTADSAGLAVNNAAVTLNETDPNPADNSSSENTLLVEPVLAATKTDTLLTDSDLNSMPSPGDTLRYQIQISNSGGLAATGVIFADVPGANTTLVTGSVLTSAGTVTTGKSSGDGSVEVQVGTIAAGTDVTVTFDAIIASPLPTGVSQVSNQGTVISAELAALLTDDPDAAGSADPTVTPVTAEPVLSASMVDSLLNDADTYSVPSAGDTLRYTVTIANTGNASATGASFHVTAPAGTTGVIGSVQTTMGTVSSGNDAGDTAVAVLLGTLASGATVTVTLDVILDDPLPAGFTEVSNQGTVSSNELADVPTDDPDAGGATDPTLTPVVAAPEPVEANLSLTKTVSPPAVAIGSQATYTLLVTNQGPDEATGVVVTDTMPANLTPTSTVASQGSCFESSGTISCNLGTLAQDASASVTVVVTVAGTGGTIVNNASVVADQDDPAPADNSAAVVMQADIAATPTLGEIGLSLMTLLLALTGGHLIRKRSAAQAAQGESTLPRY